MKMILYRLLLAVLIFHPFSTAVAADNIHPLPNQQESSPPADTGTSSSGQNAAGDASDDGYQYHQAYYLLDHLNRGMPKPDSSLNLRTPQATMENFLLSSREKDFSRAARSLNLNLIPQGEQSQRGPALAEKLYEILDRQVNIIWDDLPDRPDGQVDSSVNNKDPLKGQPRRSIEIGDIAVDGRSLPIRIQRVKTGKEMPVWVFSASTVENIPEIHEKYGPGLLDRRLPSWAKVRMGGLPIWEWAALVVLLIVSLLIGWLTQKIIVIMVKRAPKHWSVNLADSFRGPLALLAGLLIFYVGKSTLISLSGPTAGILNPLIMMFIVFAVTWLAVRVIRFITDYMSHQYVDELKHFTQIHQSHLVTAITVIRRMLIVFAVILGIGIALSQLDIMKMFGVSLLASAGIASIIIGVAAQSLLGNMIGGLQIAVSQPIRMGDSVFFEGNWGYIEKITFTYILIQTWDQRRIVVPMKYFLDHPFENWTKEDTSLIKPIHLYADYRIDIEKVRQHFEELLRNSEDWDETVDPLLQVTGVSEKTIEIRALCSGKDPIKAWMLHCDLREKMIHFVQNMEDGLYLPRHRMEIPHPVEADIAGGDGGSPAESQHH